MDLTRLKCDIRCSAENRRVSDVVQGGLFGFNSKIFAYESVGDSVSRSIRARFSAHRHRPRRRPAAQGRAMSNGCTFSPPVIRGFDGLKRSRSSRFLTSARATTKASFRLLACRSATLKKALPK